VPVSVDIAPTKTLAKVANHVAKKDQKHGGAVLLLDEAAQDAALARIELTDWKRLSVGSRMRARMCAGEGRAFRGVHRAKRLLCLKFHGPLSVVVLPFPGCISALSRGFFGSFLPDLPTLGNSRGFCKPLN
jgi:hypothetical protein